MTSPRRKILAFSGCRSDYDLLSGLFKKLHADPAFDFGLLVSGAHLSPIFGETVRMIEADKLPITARVASIPEQTRHEMRLESAAGLFQGAVNVVAQARPDLLLFGGDREDVIIAALIGVYLGIPTAHCFGGDHAKDGHVDHLVRHATSKLASLHFVSMEEHRQRLIAMGEAPGRIFQIGSPALDKFLEEPPRSPGEIFREMGCAMPAEYAILIYHPMPEEGLATGECFENILRTLEAEKIFTLVSSPNIDHGHEEILEVIARYRHRPNFHFYHNLPRNDFVNVFRHAAFLIGNSSAGLVEAPMIPLPVINVGERQRGRASSNNVLFVDGHLPDIERALKKIESESFREGLKETVSLYGDGHSTDKACHFLRELDYRHYLRKPEDPLTTGA